MGQKIKPISLRLNKKKNWESSWVVNHYEYPLLLHFNLEIKKYFEKIFNYKGVKLIDLKIIKVSNNIFIYVYIQKHLYRSYPGTPNKLISQFNYYYPNNNIKLFIKTVYSREFFFLRHQLKRIFFRILKDRQKGKKQNNYLPSYLKKMIFNFCFAFYTKRLSILTFYIKQTLTRNKRNKKLIYSINNMFESFFKLFYNIRGYRLQIKGRLNKSKRKKKMAFQKGGIPLNTINSNVQYHFNEFKTTSGICSIKLWVCFIRNKRKPIFQSKQINYVKSPKYKVSKTF